ncbi:MAG: amidohydrolase family protein [Flavobacteriales bacterium]|nr:amidohydrolase family protein [Flavobacteriales bacterium]
MLRYIFSIFFTLLLLTSGKAQHIAPENGVHDPHNTIYALTNCKVVVNADLTIPLGMVMVQDGIITYAGIMKPLPKDAVKIDLKGYTLYPSFIDIYSSEGVVPPKYEGNNRAYPQPSLKEGPFYWNQAVHPETNAYDHYKVKQAKNRKALIQQGFGVISTHVEDGVMRGTSVLVSLSDHPTVDNVIKAQSANHYSFSKGSSKQHYPGSQMGCIALIRQFYYDAIWYKSLKNPVKENVSLQAALNNEQLPHFFGVSDKLEILRAAKIAQEFRLDLIVKGGGDEYERIDEIKQSKAKLVIPLNFPDPFDVTDPYTSRFISLADLKSWEMRPYNPYMLYRSGIPFALTSKGLKSPKTFMKKVKVAIKHGLPKNEALRALTQQPAEFLGVDSLVGSIAKGKLANFLVVKGDLFEGGEIYENWLKGDRQRFKDIETADIRGKYDININKVVYELDIKGSIEKPSGKLTSYGVVKDSTNGGQTIDTTYLKTDIEVSGLQVSISFVLKDEAYDGLVQLNGTYNPTLGLLHGTGQLPNGYWVDWNGIRSKNFDDKKKSKKMVVDTSAVENIRYPNMAFGFDTLPEAKSYFIKNATLWTNEKEGIIKKGTLYISDGKIKSVNARSTSIGGAIVIDAEGKHVTSGIIDEHSHIAISKGVNEGGQAITAEVSIGDVVRSDDINIFRQLAGGVTAAQLLHGSANPIGGKSALIKLKWGFSPEEMLIQDAAGFIKFALGENVKQSRSSHSNRYPQTRMGVEQLFYDAFIRAKEYEVEWKEYFSASSKKRDEMGTPRRDLELEALLEVVHGKRFISCHSYVQSEINMLMHVADSMGFTVNTFTHILEGYKVADKMLEHGAGASTFADWWAYKYEVNEAIPYNAAILSKMGVVTAINSDDAEMGRRLNQEAAKAVKYGGVSEEEAWKMVTLNPAKLLHLDDRMGSLKAGKDADIVIWSDNPLSIKAKVEKTFIDGALMYDSEKIYYLKSRDTKDRKRIMQKMIEAKKNGSPTRKAVMRKNPQYHCDTEGEEG